MVKKPTLDSNARHEIVFKFLRKIGVPKKIAEEDSEGMEHHISLQTLKIMKKSIYIIILKRYIDSPTILLICFLLVRYS